MSRLPANFDTQRSRGIRTNRSGQQRRPPLGPSDVLSQFQDSAIGAADFLGSQFPQQKFTQARKALIGDRQFSNFPGLRTARDFTQGLFQQFGPIGAQPPGAPRFTPNVSGPAGLNQLFPTGPLGNAAPQQQFGAVPPVGTDLAGEIAFGLSPTPVGNPNAFPQPFRPSPPTPGAPAGTQGFEPNRSIFARPPEQSDFLQETAGLQQAGQQALPPAPGGFAQAGSGLQGGGQDPFAARRAAMFQHARESAELRRFMDAGGTPATQALPGGAGTTIATPTFGGPPEGPAEPFATANFGERIDARGQTRTQQTSAMLARPLAMLAAQPDRLAGPHSFSPGVPGLDDRRDLTFAEWTQAKNAGLPVGPWQGPSGRAKAKSTTDLLVERASGTGKGAAKAKRSLSRIRSRTKARQNTGLPQDERNLLRIARARGDRLSPAGANIRVTINRGDPLSPEQQQIFRAQQMASLSPEAQAAAINAQGVLAIQAGQQTPEGLNAARAAGGFPTVPAPFEPPAGTIASRIPAEARPTVEAMVEAEQWPQLKRYLQNTLGWTDDDLDRDFASLTGVEGATSARPGGPPGLFERGLGRLLGGRGPGV